MTGKNENNGVDPRPLDELTEEEINNIGDPAQFSSYHSLEEAHNAIDAKYAAYYEEHGRYPDAYDLERMGAEEHFLVRELDAANERLDPNFDPPDPDNMSETDVDAALLSRAATPDYPGESDRETLENAFTAVDEAIADFIEENHPEVSPILPDSIKEELERRFSELSPDATEDEKIAIYSEYTKSLSPGDEQAIEAMREAMHEDVQAHYDAGEDLTPDLVRRIIEGHLGDDFEDLLNTNPSELPSALREGPVIGDVNAAIEGLEHQWENENPARLDARGTRDALSNLPNDPQALEATLRNLLETGAITPQDVELYAPQAWEQIKNNPDIISPAVVAAPHNDLTDDVMSALKALYPDAAGYEAAITKYHDYLTREDPSLKIRDFLDEAEMAALKRETVVRSYVEINGMERARAEQVYDLETALGNKYGPNAPPELVTLLESYKARPDNPEAIDDLINKIFGPEGPDGPSAASPEPEGPDASPGAPGGAEANLPESATTVDPNTSAPEMPGFDGQMKPDSPPPPDAKLIRLMNEEAQIALSHQAQALGATVRMGGVVTEGANKGSFAHLVLDTDNPQAVYAALTEALAEANLSTGDIRWNSACVVLSPEATIAFYDADAKLLSAELAVAKAPHAQAARNQLRNTFGERATVRPKLDGEGKVAGYEVQTPMTSFIKDYMDMKGLTAPDHIHFQSKGNGFYVSINVLTKSEKWEQNIEPFITKLRQDLAPIEHLMETQNAAGVLGTISEALRSRENPILFQSYAEFAADLVEAMQEMPSVKVAPAWGTDGASILVNYISSSATDPGIDNLVNTLRDTAAHYLTEAGLSREAAEKFAGSAISRTPEGGVWLSKGLLATDAGTKALKEVGPYASPIASGRLVPARHDGVDAGPELDDAAEISQPHTVELSSGIELEVTWEPPQENLTPNSVALTGLIIALDNAAELEEALDHAAGVDAGYYYRPPSPSSSKGPHTSATTPSNRAGKTLRRSGPRRGGPSRRR